MPWSNPFALVELWLPRFILLVPALFSDALAIVLAAAFIVAR
jgi:hypothetical protein